MKDYDQLVITVPAGELWDEKNECFVSSKEQTLVLKHSLISISKWEAKWHKPYLVRDKKTDEELRDYIRCMTITQNVDPLCYYNLSQSNINEINDYIADPMTATVINDKNKSSSREIMTSELIYFMMFNYNIPAEYAKWHINRLLTLIQVCNIKNSPPKKMSKKAILSRNAALNAERRAKLHTKG
ncbi:MAG: hypothetical protein KBT06_05570 [Prevotellaceae bacterium]|nr:hypothetical protein [Candidatus Colivivens equi]